MTCPVLELDNAPLFTLAESLNRARLLASPFAELLPGEKVVDLFCGAGGWGEGARELGIRVDFAVNHWDTAINTHALNNPHCRHHLGDAWRARPRDVVGKRTKLGLLLASAACTTHSRARGSAPISKRVHMLGWCIARWMEETAPRIVLIENVPEWREWGPTILRDGVRVQDPARKGQHFRRWWRYCTKVLGYVMEMRVLDAPDYGAASRRRRLFVVARRDGVPIVWPEKSHGISGADKGRTTEGSGLRGTTSGEGEQRGAARGGAGYSGRAGHDRLGAMDNAGSTGLRSASGGGGSDGDRGAEAQTDTGGGGTGGASAGSIKPFRTAASCIDWQDLGTSIFDRKRPLKPKTQARIAEGIRRYVIADPAPFVLQVTQTGGEGKGWKVSPIDAPMPTQTTRQDIAVCTPITTRYNGEKPGDPANAHRVDAPLLTVPTENRFGVATPVLATTGYGERDGQPPRCHRVTDLLGTAVDGVKQAVATPVLAGAGGTNFPPGRVDAPYHAVLPREDTGIATPILAGAGGSAYAGKPTRADLPMNTVKCDERRALVTPLLSHFRHGGGQSSDVREPMPATMASGTHASLVAPLVADYYGNNETAHRPDEPLRTVTTLDRHGAVNVVMSEAAHERGRKVAAFLRAHLGAAVAIDEACGLAYVVLDGARRYFIDILFRMLRPRELAKAMGFRDDYAWPKSQRDTVRLIGNAVSPPQARALLAAVLPRGHHKRRMAV